MTKSEENIDDNIDFDVDLAAINAYEERRARNLTVAELIAHAIPAERRSWAAAKELFHRAALYEPKPIERSIKSREATAMRGNDHD